MLQLIAQGPQSRQRWRQTLASGQTYLLGRSTDADLPVPWEPYLSGHHARLSVNDSLVEVRREASATNPIFHDGAEHHHFDLLPNRSFTVGETRFMLVALEDSAPSSSEQPLEEFTFTRQQLQKVRFHDADRRIEALSRLPEVIARARTQDELHTRLTNLLLAGVRYADAAGIVQLDEHNRVRMPYWERRRETAGAFRPSSRLVTEAVQKLRRSVLHVWETTSAADSEYTASAEFDWAFCTPVVTRGRERWGLYVAGQLDTILHAPTGQSGVPELHGDIKFVELLAEIINSVWQLQRLEGNLSVLRQFLAPPILDAIERSAGEAGLNTEMLDPREADVTVMFCDLRGFSHQAEESADDLRGLLDRVSAALEVMTQQILRYGGVTGDFLGDAALGFWGWPFASEEAPVNACRAAMGIWRTFEQTRARSDHPLANFEVGIGIAHGRAVAGKLGTRDMVKVTVFGPVVNLASRLETMTKQLRVPILLDEATATSVRERLPATEGRTRRLGKVLPYGLETPLVVSELVPPLDDRPDLTDDHLRLYEEGVTHFLDGRWEEAYGCLHQMPPSDRAQDFLAMRIAQDNRRAPADWDGVIRLPRK
ncbi:MAG: adenylate/guanylate cyclase domain-containing protein [Maioricimonas sp. JB045]